MLMLLQPAAMRRRHEVLDESLLTSTRRREYLYIFFIGYTYDRFFYKFLYHYGNETEPSGEKPDP